VAPKQGLRTIIKAFAIRGVASAFLYGER